ncbi:MAG: heme-binding protein, partial [Dehalococcoidia bacterium]
QPSVELQERYNTPVMNALTLSENGRLVPWQGALPIKRADGSVVGAIGVSGARSDEDEAVAQAGIDVL